MERKRMNLVGKKKMKILKVNKMMKKRKMKEREMRMKVWMLKK
jgi:hypothetical protein